MRYQGTIVKWKDDEGYGFVVPRGGGDHVFLHANAVAGRTFRPTEKLEVTYEVELDEKGRKRATDVRRIGDVPRRAKIPRSGYFAALVAVAVVVGLALWHFFGKLSAMVPAWYLTTSLITYVVYVYDKAQAESKAWRAPEERLQFLALIGGWPGALAAQHIIRHKTSKPSFLIVFWIVTAINCAALLIFFTPVRNVIDRIVNR
jgi:uncharacterized membrane protein YsdA (DUF1294 family)/cold shock CspA family protein